MGEQVIRDCKLGLELPSSFFMVGSSSVSADGRSISYSPAFFRGGRKQVEHAGPVVSMSINGTSSCYQLVIRVSEDGTVKPELRELGGLASGQAAKPIEV